MPIPDRFIAQPLTVRPEQNAREAARLMEDEHVGALVVVGADGRPVGMLTDRDLALGVLTRRRTPEDCTVRECMSAPLISLPRRASLIQASEAMRQAGIRRLPLVDEAGELVGLLSADELIELLGSELARLAEAVRRGIAHEKSPAPTAGSIFGYE